MASIAESPDRHLLTVLHSFERTGPPLLALRFLRWLREQRPGWTLSTLSLGGDDALRGEFADLGPTLEVTPVNPAGSRRHAAKAAWINRRLRREVAELGPIHLAHVHCAGSMRVLDVLPPSPVLLHVHELSVGLELHLGARAAAHVRSADRYVAVSDAVRQAFLSRWPVDHSRIDRQWGFVDIDELPTGSVRTRLGVPDDAMLIVGSGVRNWRKAPELFVRAAAHLAATRPDVPWRFVWVGGRDEAGLQHLVDRAGLGAVVQLLDHRPDSMDWVAASDVFFLSAREDAFPLVCVEAAAMGRPLVSFDSGGTPELIRNAGCGAVAPFPDVEAAAGLIADLCDDPDRRSDLGVAGAAFARQHLTVHHAGPLLLQTIEETMSSSARDASPRARRVAR